MDQTEFSRKYNEILDDYAETRQMRMGHGHIRTEKLGNQYLELLFSVGIRSYKDLSHSEYEELASPWGSKLREDLMLLGCIQNGEDERALGLLKSFLDTRDTEYYRPFEIIDYRDICSCVALYNLYKYYQFGVNHIVTEILRASSSSSLLEELAPLATHIYLDICTMKTMEDLEIYLSIAKRGDQDIYNGECLRIKALSDMSLVEQHKYLVSKGFPISGKYWTGLIISMSVPGAVFRAISHEEVINRDEGMEYAELVKYMLESHVPIDNDEIDGFIYQQARYGLSPHDWLPAFFRYAYSPADFTPLYAEMMGQGYEVEDILLLEQYGIPLYEDAAELNNQISFIDPEEFGSEEIQSLFARLVKKQRLEGKLSEHNWELLGMDK